jgi:hypothetical protein
MEAAGLREILLTTRELCGVIINLHPHGTVTSSVDFFAFTMKKREFSLNPCALILKTELFQQTVLIGIVLFSQQA